MKKLQDVKLPDGFGDKVITGIEAFDEIFGSDDAGYGFVRGKVYLVSAPPGTGKSRLFLLTESLIAQNAANEEIRTAHVTTEQSVEELVAMCKKSNVFMPENMLADKDNNWESIKKKVIDNNVGFLSVDSLPLIMKSFDKIRDEKSGIFRERTVDEKIHEIKDFACKYNLVIVLINHCTKGGSYKGSSGIEHLVDCEITLRKNYEDYDGMKVIEFYGGKNREGTPVNRAFPFNGIWDLSCPFDIEGKKDPSGANNGSKVAERKEMLRANFFNSLNLNGNEVTREQIETETFSVTGMVKSSIYTCLRELVEAGTLTAHRQSTGSRGQPPIVRWTVNGLNPAAVESGDSAETEAEEMPQFVQD